MNKLSKIEQRFERIMNDYKHDRITEETLAKYLHYLTYDENNKYYRNAEHLSKVKLSGTTIGADDEIVDDLRKTSIVSTIKMLKGVLTEQEYSTLSMWCVDDKSMQEIADELGTYKMDISRIIKSIKAKCLEHIGETREVLEICAMKAVGCSTRHKRKDAHSAKHKVRYPSEYLSKISMEGKWYKQKYILRNHCVCPEFFLETFGDSKTKCTRCFDQFGGHTCSRIEVN